MESDLEGEKEGYTEKQTVVTWQEEKKRKENGKILLYSFMHYLLKLHVFPEPFGLFYQINLEELTTPHSSHLENKT